MKKSLPKYIDKLLRTIIRGEPFKLDPSRIPRGWVGDRRQIEPGRWLTTVRPVSSRALKSLGTVVRLVIDAGTDFYQVACPVSYLPDDHELRRTFEESMLVNVATGGAIPDPIARGLLGALDEAERRASLAVDVASRLEADGMRTALADTLNELGRGASIADCRVGIEAAMGGPSLLSDAARQEAHPLGEPDLLAIRDKVFREVIALLDQLQAAA